MSNPFSLYFFLFEAETPDLLTDLLASTNKSSGPENNMGKTLEDMSKKLGDVDQRLKTLQRGSSEETNARSTTGAKKPLPTTVPLPSGISPPKQTGATTGTSEPSDIAKTLTNDRKFISTLAGEIASNMGKKNKR